MDAEKTIRDNIFDQRIMSLATSKGEQPWSCCLHFVADENLNMFWLSSPESRHSLELGTNSNAAISIAVSAESPTFAIQAEGKAHLVQDESELKRSAELFNAKFVNNQEWLDMLLAGGISSKMFAFKPRRFTVFHRESHKVPPQLLEWNLQ